MYRKENFQGVDFKSLKDLISNNSSEENALVGILIYYFSTKISLLSKTMNNPMQFTDGERYAFCELIFEEQNLLKYQINQMIDTRTKERKNNLLQFYHAFNDALDFIFGFLIIQKNSEEKIIKNVWAQISSDKKNIDLLVGKEDLPDYFDELIENYEDILEASIDYDPYYFTDQYDIDLKNLKKENFDQLKRDTMEGIGNTIGGVGNLFKKIIPGSKKEENLATEEKLKKINQMRNNNTITESEYQQMRVQILNKFTGIESESSLSTNKETLNDPKNDIKDEIMDLENLDETLKSGIILTAEFIENIILNPIKFNKEGRLPEGFWQDEFILGFLSYLIINTCDSIVDMSDISTEDKGVALHLIMAKLCLQESKQVMGDFNKLIRNPTENSQRGHDLSMKFLAIADNTYEITFPNDPDIEKAKKLSGTIESDTHFIHKGEKKIENQHLFLAFQIFHLNEYILGLYK